MARPDRRQEILRSFIARVADHGYEQARFSDIAAELGVSNGLIVHHFGTKLQMLKLMHEQYMLRRIAEAELIVTEIDQPVEQLSAFIYAIMLCFREDRDGSVAFTREILRFSADPEMREVRELRDRYTEFVTEVVRRGIDRDELRDEDPRLVALQIFGMCNWAWTWYRPDGRYSLEEIAASFARTVLAGISLVRFRDVLADPNGAVVPTVRKIAATVRARTELVP